MKDLPERYPVDSKFSAGSSSDSTNSHTTSVDTKTGHTRCSKVSSVWSNLLASTFSFFEPHSGLLSSHEKKDFNTRLYGWSSVKRAVTSITMRRLQERILGSSRTGVANSTSEIWLLGVCYKILPEEPPGDASHGNGPGDASHGNGLAAFLQDFSSRIWITYRKGFCAIGDSKLTSDVNWGCMLRSSQMLFAQALLVHYLGRSWRKPVQKPFDQEYVQILQHFGDSEESVFSIHNLIQAGRAYGLAAGSWVGPYAMCRSWETLARTIREKRNLDNDNQNLPMVVHVVSGDEDGERGGAPVLCIEDAARICREFCRSQAAWAPMLLLVPLVLGLEKVNPRYFPLLWATFTFPQSLGIMGGKPGASTYIVGVQDDRAWYLDPHEVQLVVDIGRDNLESDTSTYHSNVVRHMPLESIDPSLAIGFYCRDKDDFDDFCARASELTVRSNGAPLFTVAQSLNMRKSVAQPQHRVASDTLDGEEKLSDSEANSKEDDWQFL